MKRDKPLLTYLRTYRLKSGLSNDEVAFLLGSVYGTNVSKHESGHRLPLLRNALAYEIVLGTPVRRLYQGMACSVRQEVLTRVRGLVANLEKKRRGRGRELKLELLRGMLKGACELCAPSPCHG